MKLAEFVIPMEMRKDLAIKTNQYLRIEKDGDKIILEKYSYDLIKDKIKNIVLEIGSKIFSELQDFAVYRKRYIL